MNGRHLGTLFMLARRSLLRRRIAAFATTLSIAVGTSLVFLVSALRQEVIRSVPDTALGFDAVVAARSSPLEAILTSVLLLEPSEVTVRWEDVQGLASDSRVEIAIPWASGDHLAGQPILATTAAFFASGPPLRLAEGRAFADQTTEAVLGSEASGRTGLAVGSAFHPSHGASGHEEHQDSFVVVGSLARTGAPLDRAILVPLDAHWRLTGHVLHTDSGAYEPERGREIPDAVKQVNSIWLRLRSPGSGFALDREINRQGRALTFAWPIDRLLLRLYQQVGWVEKILQVLAWLTLILGACSIVAVVQISMRERRAELATLRALGAPKPALLLSIALEGGLLGAAGAALGFLLRFAGMAAAASWMRGSLGVDVSLLSPDATWIWLPPVSILIGAGASLLPGVALYRLPVADVLEGRA